MGTLIKSDSWASTDLYLERRVLENQLVNQVWHRHMTIYYDGLRLAGFPHYKLAYLGAPLVHTSTTTVALCALRW